MDLIANINSCIDDGQVVDTAKMLTILGQLTIRMKEESHRTALLSESPEIYTKLEWILGVTGDQDPPDLELECYRSLRNSMACHENQNNMRENTRILQNTLKFLGEKDLEKSKKEPLLYIVRLQFLCNCIIGNNANALLVEEAAKDFVCWYLEQKFQEAAYLINTLFNILPEFGVHFVPSERFQLFLNDVESEAHLFCLENLSSNTPYLRLAYFNLTLDQRLSYLQLLTASPCSKSVEFFLEAFQIKADLILKSDMKSLETDFQEILQLTGLVAGFKKMEEIKFLQKQGAFTMTVIQLLKMTKAHEAFEPVEKLTTLSKEAQDHPTFMFKAYLIRILGNLAYRNTQNQTVIGKHCLPIILDCTKIDTLNPFIPQWSILAIRNLLERNIDNQNLVRNLKLKGSAYSKVLQEFGIQVTVNEDGKPSVSQQNKDESKDSKE